MPRRVYNLILLATVVIVPTLAGVGWWHYWPTFHRRQSLVQAQRAVEADNLVKAEELLHSLLDDEPKDLRSRFLYAQVLRKKGRITEAWNALHQALQLGLPESEGLREYALLESVQDFPLAINALERVLEEHPEDAEVHKALAEGYAKNKRWVEAERAYSRWLAVQPARADLHLERGKVLLEAGRADQAADEFQVVLRNAPQDFQARLLLAQCFMNDFKMEEAESELQECRRLRPSASEPLVGLASCAAERGDGVHAQALAKEALALDPQSPLALHFQGSLFLTNHKLDLAIGIYEKIVRLYPRDKLGHLSLARAYSQLGNAELAKQHEERFRQLDLQDDQRTKEMSRLH
jgi:predicted Zn-dependent protease